MGRLCFTCGAVLGVLAVALLVAPGEALNCTSQKFTNKVVYPNCTDLPHLSANLHWSYNVSNSSLSVAFVAPPAKPGGWVAWAINPTKTGMAGSQALVAFKSNGTITIQTFDIKSYNFSQSGMNLSYEVWDLRAEESGGTIKIFGKWKLPAKTEKVNQVWQVGPALSAEGYPVVHGFAPDNLASKGILQLVGQAAAISPAAEPSGSAPGPNGSAPGPNGSAPASPNGAPRGREGLGAGISMAVFVILGSLIA